MNAWHVARRLARLDRRGWATVAEVASLAACVEFGLRRWQFARLIRWAESQPALPAPAPGADEVDSLVSLSQWPSRVPGWPGSCLRRSLVLTALLRRRSVAAVVCVGVRRDGAGLRAHAWVECDGRPIGDDGEGYERLRPQSTSLLSRTARWSP